MKLRSQIISLFGFLFYTNKFLSNVPFVYKQTTPRMISAFTTGYSNKHKTGGTFKKYNVI